jgi:ABC-2 type transport system permease protein
MFKLLKYDFYHLRKTSKFIIFPVVIVIFAILSPMTARYMNDILDLALAESGFDIVLTDPVVMDSYLQYIGNLYETILFVILFVGVGFFIKDKTKGLLPLVLSKPISKPKYLLSKYVSLSVLILGSLLIGYLVFSYYTYFIFKEVDMFGMLLTTLLFFVFILYLLSISMFTATHFKSYLASVSVTFGIYILTSMLTIFEVSIFKYLPGFLSSFSVDILMNQEVVGDVLISVGITILLSIMFIYFSIKKFIKQDI